MSSMITTNIGEFNVVFSRYVQLTRRSLDDMLDKKGRDLGIRLYKGFAERKFGGPGKVKKGLALAELATRTKEGRGTLVRRSLLNEYLAARKELRRSIKKSNLRNIKQRVSLWQKYVGKEIAIRQKGIGALAASFLWFRARFSQVRGIYYVRNKTGRPLGYAEKGDGYLRIVGMTDGLEEVDARYGIVSTALTEAAADMLIYIERKERENFFSVFNAA
jgi:hypothetical protein